MTRKSLMKNEKSNRTSILIFLWSNFFFLNIDEAGYELQRTRAERDNELKIAKNLTVEIQEFIEEEEDLER